MDLYKFPKDILVKLISTLQEDVNRKKIYGVHLSNGVGGIAEDFIICADNIDAVYLHFLERKVVVHFKPTEMNQVWNADDPYHYLTPEDYLFDIERSKDVTVNPNPKRPSINIKNESITENIVNMLICWYCKKFKYMFDMINIEHIKDIFENYAPKYMDGMWIQEIKYAFIY